MTAVDVLRATVLAVAFLATTALGAQEIAKSPADAREYAAFTLPNGLGVVLVSDPSTDKAAASLDVNVGSGSDPEGRAGLAHFLEHMLFLGTEKYPDPAEYKAFISSHGGSENAYTSFDHTNYFFDVHHAYLDPALDRFAQFFVAPLFSPGYVARERQVVHSEYTSKLRSDGRRIWYAAKRAFNPAHPASRFAVGSNETLADTERSSIRDELIDFYRKHYSAGVMRLAVIGREPLDQLRRMVESRFAAVPDTGGLAQRFDLPLFEPGRLPARLDVRPIREQRRLSFTFPMPPVVQHWRTKPTRLVGDLLGHEGRGSLLATLKARGWVEGLSAGLGMSDATASTFNVSMQLTESGLANVREIGVSLFSYIDLIRRDGITPWRYEELRRIADLHFRFEEKGSAAGTVRGIASDLHELPAQEVLRGPYALDRFDADLMRGYLERLRPDNVLVTVVAKDLQTDEVTDWYEVDYRLEELDPALLAAWRRPEVANGIALPEANPFIPENLARIAPSAAADRPRRILERPGIELWHQLDRDFGLPRTDFFFSVRSPVANDSPRHALLTALFVGLVNDALETFSYPTSLAGMQYALYKHLRGFTVRFSGYSDKEAMLVERITTTLHEPPLRADRFEIVREELARGLRNATKRSPASLARAEIHTLLLDPDWTEQEMLEIVGDLTLEDLRDFVPRLLASIDVVALAHGNLDQAKALTLAGIIERELVAPARTVEVESGSVIRLEPGDHYVRPLTSEHQDSATLVYYQGESPSFHDRALVALLGEVLSSPFFDVLRTERQLGYVVYSTPVSILEVPGLAFVVQSPTTGPEALADHIERFLRDHAGVVESMDEQTLGRHRASVISRILEREPRLDVRSARYWTEIDRRHLAFDSREQLAEALRAIDREAFVNAYRSLLVNAGRRGIAIEVAGTSHAGPRAPADHSAASGASVIEDARVFKSSKQRVAPR
jgi:secreted Zn-dependent insulinase-like peptidase